ncbi:MAG: hypothetical protein II972_04660 [Elusimicrobiaceae bacterium]|nr:hypothetical protein [Elusimicrobiaceae bacterium]
MNKIIFSLAILCLFFGACNSYSPRNYKKYTGIKYEDYMQNEKKQELLNTDLSDIEQSDISAPVFEHVEALDDDSVVESTNSAYGEAVVVMATKKVALGKEATTREMQFLQTGLENSYNATLRNYRVPGFTYSLTPAGEINPLSVFEVKCVLSENYANATGKRACDFFFGQINQEYMKVKEEASLRK